MIDIELAFDSHYRTFIAAANVFHRKLNTSFGLLIS